MGPELIMYTIYTSPHGTPDTTHTIRAYRISAGGPQPTGDTWATDTLEQARQLVTQYADYCITRAPDDDPTIIETWM